MMLNPVEARASSATSSEPITRSFLFLQGCTGPFFRTLGLELKRAGHRICRVNFHGGDVFDWPLPDTRMYRGNRADWSRYFLRLVDEQQVTDLVLFADCRPLHADAIQILKAWRPRVRVHVFEEGYLRPDWITLERDGVNAHSPLMQVRGGFLSQPDALAPCAKVEKVGTAVVPQSLHAIGYFLSSYLTRRFFPHYTHQRRAGAGGGAAAW